MTKTLMMLTMVGLLHNSGGLSLRRCLPAVTPKFVLSFSFSLSQNLPSFFLFQKLSPNLFSPISLQLALLKSLSLVIDKEFRRNGFLTFDCKLLSFVSCDPQQTNKQYDKYHNSDIFTEEWWSGSWWWWWGWGWWWWRWRCSTVVTCLSLSFLTQPWQADKHFKFTRRNNRPWPSLNIGDFLAPMEYGHDVMLVILW